MINFKNKKILITGATGAIGGELVKKFISLEGNVLATGTNTEKLDSLKKQHSNIKVKKFDISEHSRIEEFIDNVSLELGGLDILINNGLILFTSVSSFAVTLLIIFVFNFEKFVFSILSFIFSAAFFIKEQ